MTTMTSDARANALVALSIAYDELAEIEQQLVDAGEYGAAEVAHDRAQLVLVAYNAEATNPPTPIKACGICHGVRWCEIRVHLLAQRYHL